MKELKDLISGENVDAIFINNEYQDQNKPLKLKKSKIKYYQCSVKISTTDGDNIEIHFQSANDLVNFIKAYEL